ncbi:MAG: glycosyltransferase family 2 protein [Chitinophagales bacterium]|nr:glycosyltransferase [Bacteroidota bacterium]
MSKHFPKISVITASFNQASLLDKCLQNIIAQNYPALEILVIDGGSDQATLEVIQKYAQKIDYWVSEKDAGIYDAYNKGIAKATGDFLYFIGNDDVLRPNALNELFGDTSLWDKDLIYGQAFSERFKKNVGEAITTDHILFQSICHQATFYRRSLFDKLGYYDTKYSLKADHVFHIRCFADSAIKKQFVPKVIANYGGFGTSAKKFDADYWFDEPQLSKQIFKQQLSTGTIEKFAQTAEIKQIYASLRHEKLLPAMQKWASYLWQKPQKFTHFKKGVFWLAMRFS